VQGFAQQQNVRTSHRTWERCGCAAGPPNGSAYSASDAGGTPRFRRCRPRKRGRTGGRRNVRCTALASEPQPEPQRGSAPQRHQVMRDLPLELEQAHRAVLKVRHIVFVGALTWSLDGSGDVWGTDIRAAHLSVPTEALPSTLQLTDELLRRIDIVVRENRRRLCINSEWTTGGGPRRTRRAHLLRTHEPGRHAST